MKTWTCSDEIRVEEIKIALSHIETEHSVSYSEEYKWLDSLKHRE